MDIYEQPTLVEISFADNAPAASRSNVSLEQADVVAGTKLRFSAETAQLLQRRLASAAVVFLVIMSTILVRQLLLGNTTLISVRVVLLAVIAVAWWKLRAVTVTFRMRQLRLFEFVIFGAVLIQIALMTNANLLNFAATHDLPSLLAARYILTGAWSTLILSYGVFVPNTWRRAACVVVPAAAIPYVQFALLANHSESIAEAFAINNMAEPMPATLIAALVSIAGTHIINSVRRDAFKARQLGQYHLKEKLGSGGMGEVHMAEHRMLKRPCAIKLIRAESESDAKAIAQFEIEVQTTAQLSHWNTVEIFDYGRTDDGTFYYVMELLPGMSLQQLVDRFGKLSPGRILHFLRQTCGALAEAHAAGLIHRDIKPDNIFASMRGGVHDVAKLLDFGLVRHADDAENERAKFSGSPLYMPPEQASNYDLVDGRSDIYALGAVAYFLLTGKPPFVRASVRDILIAHASADVVSPTELEPSVPADLEAIVMKCLGKMPADRFQDVRSLKQALDSCECAADWDNTLAFEWWQQHGPSDCKTSPSATGESVLPTETIVESL